MTVINVNPRSAIISTVTRYENKCTLPTAASPSRTSLTLLLGFGAFALAGSDMIETVRLCVMVLKQTAGWAVVQGATPVEAIGAIRQKDELAGSAFGRGGVGRDPQGGI